MSRDFASGGVSMPLEELPVKNGKAVRNTIELYMANRRIQRLQGFDNFVNLEALWINNNQIASLDGIDTCTRLKELYAHNNNITSVSNCAFSFRFLEKLSLANNMLRDLDATALALSKLKFLQVLEIYGNPLAAEQNYREAMIRALPALLVLDNHEVTAEERRNATQKSEAAEAVPAPIAFGTRILEKNTIEQPRQSVWQSVSREAKNIRTDRQREVESHDALTNTSHNLKILPCASEEGRPRDMVPGFNTSHLRAELRQQYAKFHEGRELMQVTDVQQSIKTLPLPMRLSDEDIAVIVQTFESQCKTGVTYLQYETALLKAKWFPLSDDDLRQMASDSYAEAAKALANGDLQAAALATTKAIEFDSQLRMDHPIKTTRNSVPPTSKKRGLYINE